MDHSPTRREFLALSRSGRRVPVSTRLPLESDIASLFEAVGFGAPHVLLESARLHPATGRYSILVGEPSATLTARGDQVELRQSGGVRRFTADPFETLEAAVRARPALRLPGLPPFVGGAVGAIGFEASRLLESLPSRAEDDLHLPDMAFLLCDEAVVVDHLEQNVWVIALADPARDPARAYDAAVTRVEALARRLTRSPGDLPSFPRKRESNGRNDPRLRGDDVFEMTSTHTRAEFEAMVRRAKRFISEGEIYQANLSQRFTVPLREAPWSLYRRLRQINPSPFAAFADFGFLQMVSCSPERLLRVQGQAAQTRPIAGTRPRGGTAVETARLRRELLLNEKERAEHLMLVDLERNDLGRVCEYGSVRVDDLMGLEEYSHVIHIVSNVQGRLRPGAGLRELAAAVFPGGTISGCPKIRSLEVIDELEPVRRHFYTGSLGYVSYTGDIDLNILIRTAFVTGGAVHVQAGAGIVADSDPSREYEETLHKAQALLEALTVRPELVEGRADLHRHFEAERPRNLALKTRSLAPVGLEMTFKGRSHEQ